MPVDTRLRVTFVIACCVLAKAIVAASVDATSGDDKTPRKASWRDHPILRGQPGAVVPPILVWFTTRTNGDQPWSVGSRGRYTLQGSRYDLMSPDVQATEAKKLHNFDLLAISGTSVKSMKNFLELETTRKAQVCMVLSFTGFKLARDTKMTIPGWTSVGSVRWDKSAPRPRNIAGSSSTVAPIGSGYVVCKPFEAGVHSFGSPDLIRSPHPVRAYNLLFSDLEGKPPALPTTPPEWVGAAPVQHELCPKSLHDMWTVGSHDPDDPDVSGKQWATWHPQVDYIYRCYYGHEHGSPGCLAGYTERYDYTAWKNGRQDESHEGFKGYVMPAGKFIMYLGLHSDTNDLSRVDKEHHTVVVAITDKTSGALQFEMSCKSSSGGSAADFDSGKRPKDGPPVLPLGNAATQKLIVDMYSVKRSRDRVMKKKRINWVNPGIMDPRLRVRDGNPLAGIYEGWKMQTLGEICMNTSTPYRSAGPEVDIKNSHTGCMDRACTKKVMLGRRMSQDGKPTGLRPNLGNNRQVLMRDMHVGPQYCDHELPSPGGDGFIKFYTNNYCTEMCDGPSKDCILQKIHKDFTGASISGHFEVSDLHGHYPYEDIGLGMGDKRKKGLRGIGQVDGALVINAERGS